MASPNTRRNADKTGTDLYNTPLNALEAAWKAGVFDRFRKYWDPCDGLGAISNFLNERSGFRCFKSDIVQYRPKREASCRDFFTVEPSYVEGWGIQCIVMNPPFKQTEEFIDHALHLCPNLIMFNRATVLETASRTEKHLSGAWPLEKFWSFGNRVSCTEGPERKKTSNSVWYGWFLYSREYKGPPQLDWLFADKELKG